MRGRTRALTLLLVAGCVVTAGGLSSISSASQRPAYSLAELNNIKLELDRSAPKVPGTGWAVEEATQSVLVIYDETVVGDKFATLHAAVAPFGSAIRLEQAHGTMVPDMAGGNLIVSPIDSTKNTNCTLGFNAIRYSTNTYYAITAGHCTLGHENWYTNNALSVYMGHEVSSRYGGPSGVDMGLIEYDNLALQRYGGYYDYRDQQLHNITESGNAAQGDSVCKSGITTHTTCGYVTHPCGTITYQPNGPTLICMIWSTYCSQPGDSGAPVWHSTLAVGVHSGGMTDPKTGACIPPEDGGRRFAQRVLEIEGYHDIRVF